MTASDGMPLGISGLAHRRATAMAAGVKAFIALLMRPPRFGGPMPVWRQRRLKLILAGIAILLAMLFLDEPAYQFIFRRPAWLFEAFDTITDFGRSGWILVPVGGLMLLIGALASSALDRMTRGIMAAVTVRLAYVFVAVGLPGLAVTIGKRLIGRVRPSALGPFAYEPFSWRSDFASLPSGHATTAFATLVAVGAVAPRFRPLLWTYALVIAASRVMVGAHFLSDVIAGAMFGVFGAVAVQHWFAVRGLGFHIGKDGTVRANGGPSWQRLRRVAGALVPQ